MDGGERLGRFIAPSKSEVLVIETNVYAIKMAIAVRYIENNRQFADD